jgi:sec-independent protein translocase protein TatA
MLHAITTLFPTSTPLAIGMPSGFEWLIIAGIGLLIFGKRLPEVGRSLGKGIVEFKKGLKGVEDEVSQVDRDMDKPKDQLPRPQATLPQQTTVQQFDPFTGKPITAPSVREGETHT